MDEQLRERAKGNYECCVMSGQEPGIRRQETRKEKRQKKKDNRVLRKRDRAKERTSAFRISVSCPEIGLQKK